MRFDVQEKRDPETEPRFYAILIGDGLDPLVTRDFAPVEVRLKSLDARLRGIPALVATAKKRLAHPARVSTETAIEQIKGLVGLCEHDLPELFAKVPAAASVARSRAGRPRSPRSAISSRSCTMTSSPAATARSALAPMASRRRSASSSTTRASTPRACLRTRAR